MVVFYIALGGAIGASGRYLLSSFFTNLLGNHFPYGTMFVNILGSFFMGVLITSFVKTLPHSIELRSFLAVGVLGGFTTFSAFSLDVVNLFERGEVIAMLSYVIISVFVSIIALFLGMMLVRGVF